jgi:hypothetical protein
MYIAISFNSGEAIKMQDGLYLPTKFSSDDVMFICQVPLLLVNQATNPKISVQLPPEDARDMSTFNKVPYWLVVEYVLVKDGLSEAAAADRHAAIKAIRDVRSFVQRMSHAFP